MKIHNTVHYFLEHFQPTSEFLEHYHAKFAPHFTEYFLYHLRKPEEKKAAALEHYPGVMKNMREVNEKIEQYIHGISGLYEEKYGVEFTKDVHVIVGAFGSNAYTHRQVIPEITFCIEKLSANDDALQVIVAHEFGHALHNLLSDQKQMNWAALDWESPYTWLLQEGSATYFSKQVVEAEESVYFSYDHSGGEWLQFAKENQEVILRAFMDDLDGLSTGDLFREWFSINGGIRFGHTRLAYYIGYVLVEWLVEKFGEMAGITLWNKPMFERNMMQALEELADVEPGGNR